MTWENGMGSRAYYIAPLTRQFNDGVSVGREEKALTIHLPNDRSGPLVECEKHLTSKPASFELNYAIGKVSAGIEKSKARVDRIPVAEHTCVPCQALQRRGYIDGVKPVAP